MDPVSGMHSNHQYPDVSSLIGLGVGVLAAEETASSSVEVLKRIWESTAIQTALQYFFKLGMGI